MKKIRIKFEKIDSAKEHEKGGFLIVADLDLRENAEDAWYTGIKFIDIDEIKKQL